MQTPTMTKNVLLAGPTGTCPEKWTWLSQAKRNTANARMPYVQSDVPDGNTQRLRHELEGVWVGFDGHVQQTERFNLLAADPSADLVGFSDGSLSDDGNNGGYSWMIALVKDGTIQKGDVCACWRRRRWPCLWQHQLTAQLHSHGGTGIGCWHVVCTRMDWEGWLVHR